MNKQTKWIRWKFTWGKVGKLLSAEKYLTSDSPRDLTGAANNSNEMSIHTMVDMTYDCVPKITVKQTKLLK